MQRTWHHKVLLAAIGLSLSVGPALAAPPEGKGNHGKHGHDAEEVILPGHGQDKQPSAHGGKHQPAHTTQVKRDRAKYQTAGITALEARRLVGEVHVDYGGYQALPPGIRKNLARGKPLPPGIAKKQVPQDLLLRLPVHPGYEWRVAGTDLLLVTVGTMIVHEILKDVFLH